MNVQIYEHRGSFTINRIPRQIRGRRSINAGTPKSHLTPSLKGRRTARTDLRDEILPDNAASFELARWQELRAGERRTGNGQVIFQIEDSRQHEGHRLHLHPRELVGHGAPQRHRVALDPEFDGTQP